MTGGGLIGLILLSMAWLFFVLGTLLNLAALLRGVRTRKPAMPPIPLLPGVVGSLAAFFTIPALARQGSELAWPWFWIFLPLLIEVLGFAAAYALRGNGKNP